VTIHDSNLDSFNMHPLDRLQSGMGKEEHLEWA